MCKKFKEAGIKYGFGGIARVGAGELPAEMIIREHYRLGSTMAILSRSFCNTKILNDKKEIEEIFKTGIKAIREVESEAKEYSNKEFEKNKKIFKKL